MEWINRLQRLVKGHVDLVAYALVGGASTFLNVALYYLFSQVLQLHYLLGTAVAYIIAMVFSFFGNKYFVFKSADRGMRMLSEFLRFVLMRLLTGGFDLAFMFVTVQFFAWNDMLMKVISNIVVIVGNYIFSKLLIFKNHAQNEEIAI